MVARYRTRTWAALREKQEPESQPGFFAHLRSISRSRQIAYQCLMAKYDGSPLGVECRNTSRDSWGVVLANVYGDLPWRIQYFDLDGFSSHHTFATLEEAVEDMLSDGYRIEDVGALDRVSASPRWALGVRRMAIMQRHQEGQIDWQTCIAEMKKLAPQAA